MDICTSIDTGARNTPVPAYVACGLKSAKELSKLSNAEIAKRIREYYSISH